MNEFKMNVLFNQLKDKRFNGSETFYRYLEKNKFKLTLKEKTELYTKIINYQVKTYGESL